jgi:hypothetical protein
VIEITYYFRVGKDEPISLYRSERVDKGLHMYTWKRYDPEWRKVESDHPIFKWFYNGDLDYESTTEEIAQKYFPEAFN